MDYMQEDSVFEKAREIVSNILNDNKIELVEMTYRREGGRRVLRILVDTEGGISIDECAKLNEIIGETLDAQDIINEHYILEVSSPGLDRPLKSKNDFLRLKGKRIRAHTYEPIAGKREFAGVLEVVSDDSIGILEDAHMITIPLDKISKATFDYLNLI